MRFALHIAISHLRSGRREAGVSAITLISVAGVMVGVAALIAVMSVMAGFEIDLRNKIVGSNAHVVVRNAQSQPMVAYRQKVEQIQELDGVRGVAPFVYTEMMIKAEQGGVSGVIVKGIRPDEIRDVLDLHGDIVEGEGGAFRDQDGALPPKAKLAELQDQVLARLEAPAEDPDKPVTAGYTLAKPGIVVGDALATELGLMPGSKVSLVNPLGSKRGPLGMNVPDVKTFVVAGVFHSGMYEYDTKWTYVHMTEAQGFLHDKMDVVSAIEVTVNNLERAPAVANAIEDLLGPTVEVLHWKELNSALFGALQTEKIVMGIILGLIVAVASLNIAGTLILLVLSKGREISIMRAMGATSRQIRSVFMLEGLIIGVVGAGLGVVLGLVACWVLTIWRFPLDTDVYYLDYLPVTVQPSVVVMVALVGVAICFLATIYPATRAASLDPVEGLRNE